MVKKSTWQRRYPRKQIPYPFETLKHCYVTLFGGFSRELRAHQIGIRREALVGNTDLDVLDRVAVGILGEGRARPFFMEKLYDVAALDDKTPDAIAKSEFGEAVFSDRLDRGRKPFQCLRKGKFIVLSGVMGKSGSCRGEWRLDLLANVLRELRILET